jgi:CRISPR-associated protein (TIGR02584 family)
MSQTEPARFARRTLLLLTGPHPGELAEILRYLTQGAEPRFVPNEIVLITPYMEPEPLRQMLIAPLTDWVRGFCQEFALPPIQFGPANIHGVPTARDTRHHGAARPESSHSAADVILDVVSQLAEDRNRAIHASIASSARALGELLLYALSLFGRPQDRLTLALLSAELEPDKDYVLPLSMRLDGATSEFRMAEISFVRLGLKPALRPKR